MHERGEVTDHYSETRKSTTLCLFTALCISLVLSACKADRSVEGPRADRNAQTKAEEPVPTNASEALARLLKGNERFVADSPRQGHQSVARRKELVASQH